MASIRNFQEKDEKLFAEVQKLKDGISSDYDSVYRLSERYIYKIIYDIVQNHHTTEDLMQDTYVQIYNKIGTLEEARAFYVWAGRIATNLTLRYLQKSNRIRIVELPSRDEEDNPDFPYNKASMDNEAFIPESVLMDIEKQRLIAEIIEGLSIEQKITVQYFYYEEMSVNEIAEVMGCSTGTVKSRLNYARKSIKEAVVELDVKHGTRLYSLGSLPLFWFVFRSQIDGLGMAGLAAEGVGIAGAIGGASNNAAVNLGVGSVQAMGSASSGVAAGEAVASSTVATGTTAGSAGVVASAGTGLSVKVGVLVCAATVSLSGAGIATVQTANEVKAGVYEEQLAELEAETESFWVEMLMGEEPVIEEGFFEEETTQVKTTYANMIEGYTSMGIPEETVIESLVNADDFSAEMYQELDEFFAAYNAVKQSYRNCLTSAQYSIVEDKLLNLTDLVLAQQSISTEDFLSMMVEYSSDPEMQVLFDKDIQILRTLTENAYATVEFLNHPLAAEIMEEYSASEVDEAVDNGYNVQEIIQYHLNEYYLNLYGNGAYDDGKYDALAELGNRLAEKSEQSIYAIEEYTNFVSTSDRLMQITAEYQQNMSAEKQSYYQQLEQYYTELLE